jgi:GT2 family glycosyltransferase
MEEAGPSAACCLCNCAVIYQNGARTSTFDIAGTVPNYSTGIWLNPAEVLQTRFVLFVQAAAIRRDVLERIGAFDERLRFCEDYELPLRLALEGPWVIIRDELVVYQTASQGSWAAKAIREEVRMHEDLLQIRKEMLARIEKERGSGRLRALARRELRRAERELKVARLIRRGPAGARIGRALRFVERIRKAAFRRTPGYPRMVVKELALRR